ncbi:MAG TPA: hypothetical protein PK869_06465 [Candidatus Hydrogenedentes bacterium]|nr:hypothetical protein [Candidatus Hydrogenedentota bacterium]
MRKNAIKEKPLNVSPPSLGSAFRDQLRLERAVAVLLTLFLVLLHIQFARFAGGLWRDEANTVAIAGMPNWAEMRQAIVAEAKPLLSFLLVRAWQALFGDVDFAYRCLGFVIGILGTFSVWFSARSFRLSSPVISLSLIGFAPLAVSTMNSIRPYGISMLLAPLLFAFMWRFVETLRYRCLAAASVIAVLCVQTFFNNAFFVLAVCLSASSLLVRTRWREAGMCLLPGVLAALSILPYAYILQDANRWADESKVDVTLGKVVSSLVNAIGGSSIVVSVLWLLVLMFAIIRPLVNWYREKSDDNARTRAQTYALLVMLISIVSYVLFLHQMQIFLFNRYFLPLIALIGVCLDVLNTSISRDGRLRIALAFTVALLAGNTAWEQAHTRQTNMDLAIAGLNGKIGRDDLVVVAPWYLCSSFSRYYDGPAQVVTLPPMKEMRVQRDDLFKQVQASEDPLEPLLAKVTEVLDSGNRVWIIGNLSPRRPDRKPPPIPPAPKTKFGWNSGPYMANWASRLRHLQSQLEYETQRFVANPGHPLNPYENLVVEVVYRKR